MVFQRFRSNQLRVQSLKDLAPGTMFRFLGLDDNDRYIFLNGDQTGAVLLLLSGPAAPEVQKLRWNRDYAVLALPRKELEVEVAVFEPWGVREAPHGSLVISRGGSFMVANFAHYAGRGVAYVSLTNWAVGDLPDSGAIFCVSDWRLIEKGASEGEGDQVLWEWKRPQEEV